MTTIEVPLNGFVDYLRTKGAARVNVATRHLNQAAEPYSPARDFYRRILSAILSGYHSGATETALERAIDNAPPARRGHYREVAHGWRSFAPQLRKTAATHSRTGRWRDTALSVKVTPNLAISHPDNRREALLLYLKAEPIPASDAKAMLWLASSAMHEACPGARPVIVDVRRARAFRAVPHSAAYPTWLSAEAGGYRQLRDQLNDTTPQLTTT